MAEYTRSKRSAAWWRGALKWAEGAMAQLDANCAATPFDVWCARPCPHIYSHAEHHAQVAYRLWEARRHVAANNSQLKD
jgi:hypothetical protein